MSGPQQTFPKDTYLQVLKERVGDLAAAPGNWLRQNFGGQAGATMLDPNARPSAPAEAMPGSIDPLQKQALIEAILRRQQGSQVPADGQVDQRQLILQEAQRRGIPVPPDSSLLQGQPMPQGQPTPDNPAGIQF